MKILVLGAGAIGGTLAAYMTLGGEDVTVVCRREETAETLSRRGMHITGIRGERFVPLKAVCGTEKLTDQYDFCIVSTKSYDTMDAVRSVLPFLKEDGAVLVLQNGMCLDSLLELVGADRAACGVTSYSSTMVDSTHMEITGEGGFVIGMAAGGCEKLRPLKEAMDKMADFFSYYRQ